MKLYQKTINNNIKWTEIYTEGFHLITKWGLLNSDKFQETHKECIAMNEGKINSTTPETQAIAEMESKITKKKKEGSVENIDDVKEVKAGEIDLDNLSKAFCPSKPISKTPTKVLENNLTYAQRKHNGHCIILAKTASNIDKIYSRRMEDITEYLQDIPEIKELFIKMQPDSMILTEFVFINSKGVEMSRHIAKIVRKKDRAEVMRRYGESGKKGQFNIIPFDILFSEGTFVGDMDYMERYAIMQGWNLENIPEFVSNWRDINFRDKMKELGWEGFVLRESGESSYVGYTINGKPSRMGCYKDVFLHVDDFIVVKVEKGKSGKHTGFYSQFFLAQYLQNGDYVEFGKCGPGAQSHEEVKEITDRIDSGSLKIPFVIEVEFRAREGDSGKLTFAQFQRVRDDKTPEECITDFEFDTD